MPATGLTFNGTVFPGSLLACEPTPVPAGKIRYHFAGVHGDYELDGGRGGRLIACRYHFHSSGWLTAAAVVAQRIAIERLTGTSGDLLITGTIVDTYLGCTCEGFEFDAAFGFRPDPSGVLQSPWSFRGTIMFFQRKPF